MITAIDTNVLLDILVPDPQYFDAAVEAIEASEERGSLVICDVVYAELCVHFASQADCDDFLTSNEIRVEALTRAAHFAASRMWRMYRAQGGMRNRILPDFFVGAHARFQADRLITRDRGFYGGFFAGLRVVDPSAGVLG